MSEPWKCPSCFKAAEIEVVQIRQPDRSWADSSIRRCADCKHTFGGTLADRLAYINDVFGYKYFGDYELSEEQIDAVWEAKAIAGMVPALLAALVKLKALHTHFREATSGNQADAYYTFIKGEDATWREVEAVIAKLSPHPQEGASQ